MLILPLTTAASASEIDCDNALSTLQINQCTSLALDKATTQLKTYLDASLEYHADDQTLTQSIVSAQEHWQRYLSTECDAVFKKWGNGSIRTTMALTCKINLTQQRTHTLWSHYLTYVSSDNPVLPEPNTL